MATELGKAYVQIVPSAVGISGSISNVLNPEAESAGDKAGSSIAGKIKKIIAAAGIGTALKTSLSQGSALQQSLGGVETLYKKSADKVIKYANEAYRTAGLSANEYMETATAFAAGLVNSLGGDTEKAAEVTNLAIKDMSDNANKFGTDMQSVQNAYQGFAKQNYTMLDNLKLGYGGTKTEMERLLADAQKLSGQKYDIENLSDVYNAIHVIQKNLGVTGTTAKEAATTFAGSFASMKASASNLLGNMALGSDIQAPLNALLESTKTFLLGNFIPMVGNVVASIPKIVASVGNMLPMMINLGRQMAVGLITNLSSGIAEQIPQVVNQVLPFLSNLTEQIRINARVLIPAGMELLLNVAKGIANSMPTLIAYVPTIVSNVAGIINDNAPVILRTGAKIIITLVSGLIKSIPVIISNLPKIIKAIVDVFTAFNWLNLGKNIISGLKNGIVAMKGSIGAASNNVKEAIVNGLKEMPGRLLQIAKNAISGIKNGFISTNWSSVGKNIISGIVSGVKAAAGSLLSSMANIAKNALNAAKNALGIHSPSRLFRDQVGYNIIAGWESGLLNNKEMVIGAMESIVDEIGNPNVSLSTDFNSYLPGRNSTVRENNSNSQLEEMMEMIMMLYKSLPDDIAAGMKNFKLSVGERDFGRLVRRYG